MILAQISDTHILADDADPRTDARLKALERCVRDINRLDPRPRAVIHTGDMAQEGRPEEYARARAVLQGLHMPCHVTPGNRDDRAKLAAAFGLAAPEPFVLYAVDDHPVRLVALDSLSLDGHMGELCAARLQALAALLAVAPERPTALFLHHPPYDVLTAAPERRFQYHRRRAVADLARVLAAAPQVVHLFSGHAHRPWHTRMGAAGASTMPSVAPDLRMGDYPPGMAETPVYQVHRYAPETGFVSETRIAA